MTSEEKIWHILEIIDDARKIAPKGELCQYDARKIDPVVPRDEHEQIFSKLEKDFKAIEIHARPDYAHELHYRFYVLPNFTEVYEKYKTLNLERALKVENKKRDRLLVELQEHNRPKDIFDYGYNNHLIRVDPWQERMDRLAQEDSIRRAEQALQDKRHREELRQSRINTSKEDKYLHAVNLIIERASNSKAPDKSIGIDYYYFNFEGGFENLHNVFFPFLERLKEAGCFKQFEKHSGLNKVDIDFQEVSIENLKKYRDTLIVKNVSSSTPTHNSRFSQNIKAEAYRKALKTYAGNTLPKMTTTETRSEKIPKLSGLAPVYTISRTKFRELLVNEHVVRKQVLNSENDNFCDVIFRSMGGKITRVEIEKGVGSKLKKTLHQIIDDLGLSKEMRKLFFPAVSSTAIVFRKYVTDADLTELNIKKDVVDEQLRVLPKWKPTETEGNSMKQ